MRDDSAHLAEGARWMSMNDDADLRSRLETLIRGRATSSDAS